MSIKRRAFESNILISGRQYKLAVIPMPQYYRCVLDEIKTIDVRKTDSGSWVDMKEGSSQLSIAIGSIIESQNVCVTTTA